MGHLRDGVWQKGALATTSRDGEFRRKDSVCRNWITADGAPGPNGGRGFPAESGRYHLYVSYACPWAHRTLIFRALKGLEPHISVDVVHPLLGDDGWSFDTDFPGATGDRLDGRRFLRDVYLAHDPRITSRVTVPVLWDKATGSIVSNESAEIIRMLNAAFDRITGNTPRLLARGAAARDRRGQRPRLRRLQQRRLPRRLRPHAGRLRPRGRRGLRHARLAGGPAPRPALAGRRPADRGGLAARHHALPLRHGLPWPLQVQPPAAHRLSEPLGLCPRTLPVARRRRHRPLRPHRLPLLRQPRQHQPDADRADRPRDRLDRAARPGAAGCGLTVSRPTWPPRAGPRRPAPRSARSAPPCPRAGAARAAARGRSAPARRSPRPRRSPAR